MVNENIIPKTETVYELKDKYEIPSFEEFMKTYETDGKINDSYNAELGSYGDVGVPRASGPCYYANPDCTCYTSSGWVQLYVGCLANGCPNHKEPFSWVHGSCSNPMYISTNLELKCISCNSPKHMKEWRFNCHQPRHPGNDYQKTSAASFQNALSYMTASIANRTKDVKDQTRIIVIKMLEEQGW